MGKFNLTSQDFDRMDQEIGMNNNSSQSYPTQINANQNNSELSNVVNSAGIQGILGTGDAIRNTLASAANILPGVNISPANSGSGTAYNIGNVLGNLGAFVGGGEGLDAVRALSEGLPIVGDLASSLGGEGLSGVARRAIGTAAYGGLANNQNRAENAGIGGAISVGLDSIPGVAGSISKGIQYLQPQKYVDQILNQIGGGEDMQGATQSVLSSIKKAYENRSQNSTALYNEVKSQVPNTDIYEEIKKPNPLMSLDTSAGYSGYYHPMNTKFDISGGLDGDYPNLPSDYFSSYPTNDLKELHDNFIENPTFQNAHKLQSLLGQTAATLKPGLSNPATLNSYNILNSARTALKTDMNNFLLKQDPSLGLSQKYIDATNDFKNNVLPYKSDPDIADIATGETTNMIPSTLSNIFKGQDNNIAKVVSDLPSGTIDKVLYTQLGKNTPSNNPYAFLRAYGRLNEQGLGNYISPELQNQVSSLETRMKLRSLAQAALGGLAGLHAGAGYGMEGALGMGAISGALAPPMMNYLGRRLPVDSISNAVSNGLSNSYPYVRNAIAANYLNHSGVQNGS